MNWFKEAVLELCLPHYSFTGEMTFESLGMRFAPNSFAVG